MITSLQLPIDIMEQYKSPVQRIRAGTEAWFHSQLYCPGCSMPYLDKFPGNSPVADFFCKNCKQQYELKSKSAAKLPPVITDGAYHTMINRITSNQNPHFWFLLYDKTTFSVTNLLIVPNYFFTPKIIKARTPLAQTAQRAGWVGCNISVKDIPHSGRIYIVKNHIILDPQVVRESWQKATVYKEEKIAKRGWFMQVLLCVESISATEFDLRDMYKFEDHLKSHFPDNKNIKAKIRQQLQELRNRKLLEFIGNGKYRKMQIGSMHDEIKSI